MSNGFGIEGGILGIDAGASLIKVVRPDGSALNPARFRSGDWGSVADCIARARPRRILATGGGAEIMRELSPAGTVEIVGEFDAWAAGVPLLARMAGIDLPERFLLVSLGTGTSILSVWAGSARRVGGTPLGGGTVVGLGRLLTKAADFAEIAELAKRGERREVDLLLRDIYTARDSPLPLEANASSFGKLDSRRPEDLAAALMWMVGENVGLLAGALAGSSRASALVCCGSTLQDNPALENVVRMYAGVFRLTPHFFTDGAFGAALGAAALAG